MGATVVNNLTASYWAKAKPADYKNQDLDKALKTYEGVAGKTVTIPNDLVPKTPKSKVSEIEKCIKDLQNAVTELTKAKTMLKEITSALEGVQSAAGKVITDLNKQAKGKSDDDKTKYENAAASASGIATCAAGQLKDFA
jgi:hypothetical protein